MFFYITLAIHLCMCQNGGNRSGRLNIKYGFPCVQQIKDPDLMRSNIIRGMSIRGVVMQYDTLV